MVRRIPVRPTISTRKPQGVTEIAATYTIERALAQLRDGSLTSVRLTRACLDAIERLNSTLNAFIAVTGEAALERAHEADRSRSRGQWLGPLHGIPISLKDLIDQRGVPTTAGSRVLDPAPAGTDAPVTAALRRAGAVLIGKCNLHEFAFGTTSDESAFGPVRHPQDQSRVAGGSSGGSAVAVATGMSLASIGTDTGGSIRVPAAACGVVGLKASAGEVSCEGVVPLSRSLDHVGPLCRTVGDAAIVHGVLTATDPVGAGATHIASLRLGIPRRFLRDHVQPGVREAFDAACERLTVAGVTFVSIDIEELDIAAAAYLAIVLPEAAEWHARHLNRSPDRYSPGVRIRLEAGRYVLAEDYVRAQTVRSQLTEAIEATFDRCDAIALPTLGITPQPLGAASVDIGGRPQPVRAAMLRLTQPFNMSGHPAMSLPCGRTNDGWPCALQLVGRRADTRGLLALALACEPQLT